MTKLCIEGNIFPTLDGQLRQVQDRLQNAYYQLNTIAKAGVPYGISRYEVDVLHRRCYQTMMKIVSLQRYLNQSFTTYVQAEQRLNQRANDIVNKTFTVLYHDALTQSVRMMLKLTQPKPVKTKSALRYDQWHTEWGDVTHDFNYRGFHNQTLHSLLQNGLQGSGKVGVHLANISLWQRQNQVQDHLAIQVGNVDVSGKVQAKLFDEQRFDPQVQAEMSAKASLIHGLIERTWHNEVMDMGLNMSGDVGVAEAKGKAVISKDEITLKGEVGVAALQGEVQGTIEFFGATITVTAEGEVGGVGIGSEFSASSNSMEIGGKFSCLFGGGMNIKIDW